MPCLLKKLKFAQLRPKQTLHLARPASVFCHRHQSPASYKHRVRVIHAWRTPYILSLVGEKIIRSIIRPKKKKRGTVDEEGGHALTHTHTEVVTAGRIHPRHACTVALAFRVVLATTADLTWELDRGTRGRKIKIPYSTYTSEWVSRGWFGRSRWQQLPRGVRSAPWR